MSRSNRSTVFLLIVALMLLSVHPTNARQARRHDPNTPEAIPIAVSPDGFLRKTLSLPQGKYVFVVINRTPLRNMTVTLERMPGASLTDVPLRQEFADQVGTSRPRLVKSATLAPGTYRLRVANKNWVSGIIVR